MAVVIGTGSFLLFITLGVNIIALLVPYWVDAKNVAGFGYDTFGLWGECSCRWYYHDFDDIENSNKQAWFQASQWLYAVGVALMGISAITIFIVTCCSDKAHAKAYLASGVMMIVAAVLVAIAIILFGVKGHKEKGYDLDGTPKLIWGMWMGVAGFALALITSIIFLVQGPRYRHY